MILYRIIRGEALIILTCRVSILILLAKDIIDETIGVHYQITSQSRLATYSHRHDFYEVFLVVDGCMEHVLNGCARRLERHELVLVRLGDEHFYRRIRGSVLNIAFTQEIFAQIDALLKMGPCENVRISESAAAEALSGIREIATGDLTKEETGLKLRLLLVRLLSLFRLRTKPAGYPPWLEELLCAMNTREGIAEGLKRLYHLSPRTPEHTTRSFRRYLGQSPTEYINGLRLQYAENLLLTTDRTVTAIGLEAGFQDASYFSICFKRKYGASPAEYRRGRQRPLV